VIYVSVIDDVPLTATATTDHVPVVRAGTVVTVLSVCNNNSSSNNNNNNNNNNNMRRMSAVIQDIRETGFPFQRLSKRGNAASFHSTFTLI